MIDSGCVVSTAGHDQDIIPTIVENVGHAGALVQRALHHRLLHVPQVPDAPLALRLSVETCGDQRLVVRPLQALLTWANVTLSMDNR